MCGTGDNKCKKIDKGNYLKVILSVLVLVVIFLCCLAFISVFPILPIIGIATMLIVGTGVICLIWMKGGRRVFVASISVGVILICSSPFVADTQIYGRLNKYYTDMYLFMWAVFAISAIWYAFFRGAIPRLLRMKGASKSAIKKVRKGVRNYWFFDEIHEKYNIGALFYLNKAYILLFLPAVSLHIICGWYSSFVVVVVSIAVCALCAFNVPMWIVAHLSARQDRGRKKSNVLELVSGAFFPIAIAIGIITYLGKC